jgi:glycosyltransferase involved in cell wall biosynthesis
MQFPDIFRIFAEAKRILVMNNDCLLSIIVPVYNVEKYIRSCMESIFRQNLDENVFEVIIVNDGTQDRSMEMIQNIIISHPNISVINQENLSLSVARNNGIAKAKGEYILMPDSDDLLIDNSLPLLLESAIASKADLVVADFLEMTDEEIESKKVIPQKEWHVEEKSGKKLFLEDLDPYQCFVWRTLFKREFLLENHLQFVPGIRYQDVPFTHECYLKAGKCLRAKWLLNIYRKGHESATYSFDMRKAHDFCISIAETWKLTKRENSIEIQNKLKNDVYISFSTLICLISYSFEDDSVRKEILYFLKKQVPDLSFKNGLNQILTWWLYKYLPHIFINLNYYGRFFKRRVIHLFA